MQFELPDGTILDLTDGATGADAAAAIGPVLARAALAVKVDGELRDLDRRLPHGNGRPPKLEIVTDRSGADALWLIRHDAAHVLAEAVLELYPGTKVSIGPPIEDGFYYDFEFPEAVSLSEDDLEPIEAEDARAHRGRRALRSRGRGGRGGPRAVRTGGQDYKVELIEDWGETRAWKRSAYDGNGEFTDLCRGPHAAATTRRSSAFKLHPVAGAYWRGDEPTRCSRGSTAPPSSPGQTSTSTSSGSSRPARATIAGSAASSTCSTSRS